MADKLLGVRGGESVGRHWDERFVTRSGELKIAFNRAKDRQRILQDNPETISAWFKLVEDTKAKYGVHDHDVHNFDETGFQMGVIGSMKVATGAERRTRPALVQPGDREWVTVIQNVCAAGSFTVTVSVMLSVKSRRCKSIVRLATSVCKIRNPCY
jgi:hypothetical protein